MKRIISYIVLSLIFVQCSQDEKQQISDRTLFTLLDSGKTNVDFVVELGPDFRLMRNLYMNLGFRASVGITGEVWQ